MILVRRHAKALVLALAVLPTGVAAAQDASLEVQQLAAVLQAEDTRVATSELLALASASEPDLRARAALALGRVGDPNTLGRLATLAEDPAPRVRAMAAFAMGRLEYDLLASAAALRSRARDVLLDLVPAGGEVGINAALALGWVDGDARDPVGDLLDAGALDTEVTAALLHSWWQLDGATVSVPTRFSGHADPRVRLAAASALRRLDDPNRLPALATLVSDADPEVRLMAVRALSATTAPTGSVIAAGLLGDRDRRLVCAALDWLGAIWTESDAQDDEVFADVLRRSFDRALHVRRCALRALGAASADRAVADDRLLEALGEEEEAVRAAAVAAIAGREGGVRQEALKRIGARFSSEADRIAYWRAHPTESDAVASLVVAAGSAADRAEWLDSGDATLRSTMLQALVATDAGRVRDALLEQGLEDASDLALLARAYRLAPLAETDRDLSDQLWRQYFDSAVGDPARASALRALAAVDPDLANRRRELVYQDGDRVIRTWALAQWREDGLPTPEVLLAPHVTGRTPNDYRVLAEAALQLAGARPRVAMVTERGSVVVELRPDLAPLTVLQFMSLVRDSAFDGARFYRVIAGFVTQGGPDAPAPQLRGEDTPVPYLRGTVGMALSGRDTGSAHFFATHAPQPHLRGLYPVFGAVVEGQRVLERIQPGDRMRLEVVEP